MTDLLILLSVPGAGLVAMLVALRRRARRGSAASTAPHLRNVTGHDVEQAQALRADPDRERE